ncbi:hypothetical protein HanIR_Chr16g0817841 [Helianthus annuus]|nr:hypothetical protein HanIR_Chr16g0817841 [Helianthus annuus]
MRLHILLIHFLRLSLERPSLSLIQFFFLLYYTHTNNNKALSHLSIIAPDH